MTNYTVADSYNTSAIQCIAFDLFGTVFDLKSLRATEQGLQEIRDYISHVRKPSWTPLTLPEHWKHLPLHPDSLEGISRLATRYKLRTCSNAPEDFTRELLDNAGLFELLRITDIAKVKAYKPDPATYLQVSKDAEIDPSGILMVTGNEGSPDIAGALGVGMMAMRIRHGDPNSGPDTILDLASLLGC
jgi:FMN phosphatase YigB (HAD superfamily)